MPLDEIEPITEYFPTHQSIDADLALEALLAEFAGRRRGISGSHREHVEAFTDFLTQTFGAFALGGVSYERKATGPDRDRRIVALEVLCPDGPTADGFLAKVRERMAQLSVLRGQLISFVVNEFDMP